MSNVDFLILATSDGKPTYELSELKSSFKTSDRAYDWAKAHEETDLDSETKNYLDAKVDAVKAQNDARFAEVMAKLDALHPATWQQNLAVGASIAVAVVSIIFAVLAFAGDRFDGGIAATSLIDKALEEQQQLNQVRDNQIQKLIDALEAKN